MICQPIKKTAPSALPAVDLAFKFIVLLSECRLSFRNFGTPKYPESRDNARQIPYSDRMTNAFQT